MFLIISEDFAGFVLCNDGLFRSCPDFGDYPGCAKEYKSFGWACRRMRRTSNCSVLRRDKWLEQFNAV